MKRTISPRDYQLLSEYVDDQLPVSQKTRLEKRLQAEAELRKALEELRQTKALLSNLPRMKAPRNFTLTPQMVGKKAAQPQPVYRWIPVFQYATVFATFLLILVLAGDILSLGTRSTSMQAAKSVTDQGGVVMGAPLAKAPVATTMAESRALPTATASAGEQAIGPASIEGITTTITSTSPISPSVNEAPLMAQGVPTENLNNPAFATGPGEAQPNASPSGTGIDLWRWAEISLAVLALAGALTTVYLRRRA
jgi:hypothetical protein